MTAGVVLGIVGGGGLTAMAVERSADDEPTTLAMDAADVSVSAIQADTVREDDARVAADRSAVNAQVAVLAAKAEAQARVKAAAEAKARAEAKAEADRRAKRQSVLDAARENPRAAARLLMVEAGFSDSQWSCLDQLWTGESSWRYTAENASSGAYGIPQSLPASKMASVGADYRTNPVTQIKWGLQYIRDAYGTPCNAWSMWQARYPHWY